MTFVHHQALSEIFACPQKTLVAVDFTSSAAIDAFNLHVAAFWYSAFPESLGGRMRSIQETDDENSKTVGIIPLHFDVPSHAIPLETFIETAARTRDIIEAFNRSLFEGRLVYEVYVLTPEEGSFKSKLAIYLVSGVAAVGWFIESDIGKAFIEGLTNHKPEHYAQELGKYVQRRAIDLLPNKLSESTAFSDDSDKRAECTAIIVGATKSFLQKDRSELRKVGVTERTFRDAFEARNEFYKACYNNRSLKGIGFDDLLDFPVKRPDFSRLQVALQSRDEIEPIDHWNVEIISLSVTSPNWDREDRQRSWKGRDANSKERYFTIEDEQFWAFVREKRIKTSTIDTIKVQWAYPTDKRRTPRVLKVLEYNLQALGQPLDEIALSALLGIFSTAYDSQIGLFEQ